MRERPGRTIGSLALLGLMMLGVGFPPSRGASDDSAGHLARIKEMALERRWTEVLAGCERFERLFPDSPRLAAVALYEGRALSSMGGRETEALAAYEKAAERAGDPSLVEEARRSACRIAFSLRSSGRAEGTGVLARCLEDPLRTVRVYAAVLSSRLTDPRLLAGAAKVLEAELAGEPDGDLKDEMTLALARIDPSRVPAGVPGADDRDDAPARWIRLRITKRSRPDERVSINLPISFARALLESLPRQTREGLKAEVERRGWSWEALATALKDLESAAGEPLLRIDDGDERVEVWID